jgi:thiamine-monophosphate kinase
MIDPETPLSEVGERALLRHLKARIPAAQGVVIGVGDDAAAIETGAVTLLTTDVLVEGTHFSRDWCPARLLGRKALSINISDVAAMGGLPRQAVVSLCLRPELPFGWVDDLYDGLLERSAELGIGIVGGNLASTSGPIVVDVTMVGLGDRLLRRQGALSGDRVVVIGTLGAAATGLRLLRHGARLAPDGALLTTGVWTESSAGPVTRCLRAQLDPDPPWAFARSLAEQQLPHAAMDLSDGLSGDLAAMCEESQMGAAIKVESLPIDSSVLQLERARGTNAVTLALHGGEDYGLLLAVPADALQGLRDLALMWGVPATEIGEFIDGPPTVSIRSGVTLRPLEAAAYEHFRRVDDGFGPPGA